MYPHPDFVRITKKHPPCPLLKKGESFFSPLAKGDTGGLTKIPPLEKGD